LKKIFSLALFAFSILGSSSEAAQTNVEGQIFIVTKGQQTIKLALVNVVAVPERNITSSIDAKTKTILAEQKALGDTIERKKSEVVALKAAIKYNDGSPGSPFAEIDHLMAMICRPTLDPDQLARCMNSPDRQQTSARRTQLMTEYKEAMQPVLAIRRELRSLMKQHREATALLRSVLNTENLSEGSIERTKTDIDGKFSLSVPIGQRLAILAESTRAIMDSKESYQWAVWLTPKKGAKSSLLLANDNLVETRCESCVQLVDMRTYPDLSGGPEFISVQ
jgi:hypothetical protein